MQRSTFRLWIDFLILVVMLFGWIAMLSVGFRDAGAAGMSSFNPLRYGFYIFGIAALTLVFVSRKRALNERIFMGILIFGLFSLCQPFTLALYRCGFQTLLVGTLAFIIISHMKIPAQS